MATQLKLIISCCLLFGFSMIATLVYKNVSDTALNKALEEQEIRITTLANSISTQFYIYLSTAERLHRSFENTYLKGVQFTNQKVLLNGHQVYDAKVDGKSIIYDFSFADQFMQDTNAISTSTVTG